MYIYTYICRYIYIYILYVYKITYYYIWLKDVFYLVSNPINFIPSFPEKILILEEGCCVVSSNFI